MADQYNPTAVRDIIATAVERPGWSQARLARELGVRPQTVNKWVSGENTPPVERWWSIEEALGLEPGTLFEQAGLFPDAVREEGRGAMDAAASVSRRTARAAAHSRLRLPEDFTDEELAQVQGYIDALDAARRERQP